MTEEIRDTYGSEIECPYCHSKWKDSSEVMSNDGDYEEMDCDSCGKKFHANCSISIDYSCSPDCELNGGAHIWKEIELPNGRKHDFCKVCDKCRPYGPDYPL